MKRPHAFIIIVLYFIFTTSQLSGAYASPAPTSTFPLIITGNSSPSEVALSIDWSPYPESSAETLSEFSVTSQSSSSTGEPTTLSDTQVSVSSTIIYVTPLPPAISTSPTGSSHTQFIQFKLVYILPVVVVLGAILGASVAAVCYQRWIRWRRGHPPADGFHTHHFPNDGGMTQASLNRRDEDEKLWTAKRSYYSEDGFKTDDSDYEQEGNMKMQSHVSFDNSLNRPFRYTNLPPRRTTFKKPTNSLGFARVNNSKHASDFEGNRSLKYSPYITTANFDGPFSSDEDPPTPTAEPQHDSNSRALAKKISHRRETATFGNGETSAFCTTPMSLGERSSGQALSFPRRRDGISLPGTNHGRANSDVILPASLRVGDWGNSKRRPFSITMEATEARDLLFETKPDSPRYHWVTASKFIREDSGEEGPIKYGRNGKDIQSKLSQFSNTQNLRMHTKDHDNTSLVESHGDVLNPSVQRQDSNTAAMNRFQNMLLSSWSQRDSSTIPQSPTQFGAAFDREGSNTQLPPLTHMSENLFVPRSIDQMTALHQM